MPERLHPGPVILCILDGVGLGSGEEDDAVATAPTPTLDRWMRDAPMLALRAHGTAVGLPTDDDMGNSEVGHNAMGAGRVIDQGAKRVNSAMDDGSAFDSEVWRRLTAARTLHLLGLVSDGNVHSHVKHLHALIDRAVADGVTRIRVHALTDGRDVAARSALTWIRPLEERLAALHDEGVDARIASGGGRMHITMDRYEADWEMVARGWRCHVHGEGRPFPSASEAIATLYEEDPKVDDQWLPAFVVATEHGPVGRVEDGDAVLLFNFRGDRAIEISRAFDDPSLDTFDRGRRPDAFFAGMMQYDGDLNVPEHYLVSPPVIDGTVGHALADAGLRTLAASETQKFGHVTYFFNGNRSGRLSEDLERYVEVPSDNRPFQQAPWMKCAEITDVVLDALREGSFDHIRLNYANGDMVGHSGHLEAARVAMSAVDLQLERLEAAAHQAGALLLVTADHGNADAMYQRNKDGSVAKGDDGQPLPRTSHTLSLVPFLVIDPTRRLGLRRDLNNPSIANIGATLLHLLGVPVPDGWLPSLIAPPES